MEDVLMEEEQARIEEKKKEARIASKDLKTKELAAATEVVDNATSKELKKFSAHDDVALITAATHVRKPKEENSLLSFHFSEKCQVVETKVLPLLKLK